MPHERYERFARAKDIIANALARPPDARGPFLDDACGNDFELRAEVDSLLAHDVDPPSLIETGGLAQAVLPALADSLAFDAAAAVGQSIGPYELIGILGEGGMGTVYHARQREPLVREVALKLIRGGFDSARVVERFEAERRTLARLEHPGIARILDAGTDQQGRPYFVMELVRGVPVVEYADQRRLSITERLALFIDICRAVAYAHQRGVLHRDLKPGNLLVAEQDGVAVPKVIDFGIAKALERTEGGGSTITLAGHVVGTPDYMSPEQAGVGAGGDPDTRSDVYSLGVVLYELLTGHRPLTLAGLRTHEIHQHLISTELLRPSSVVASSSPRAGADDTTALDAICAARRATPTRLGRALAGDLDNIVLKSLRKEPDRRYPGVEQFADDIRRYLDGRPVMARPDTWTYRSVKFARRHRMGVAVSAAALTALVVFAGTMTWQRDRARAAEQQAAREAATARQVSAFLTGIFRQADPFVAQGQELSARALLDQAAARITRDLADQPDVQAALLATMSQAYTGLRVPEPAVALADESLRLARAQYGPRHPAVATSLLALAVAHAARSDHDRAMPLYREAIEMQRALLPADAPDLLETTSRLALNLQHVSQFEEAEALYREALAITRRTRPEDHAEVTAALQHLGGVLHAQGKTEARTVLEDALVRSRREASHPVVTADILSELAVLLKNQGLTAEAEPMYREALAIRERTFGDHPITAQSHNNLGVFLRGQGQEARALEHLQRALAIHITAFGENHTEVGIAHANVASALKSLGRVDEAERGFQSALASIEASVGRDHWIYGQLDFNYGLLLRDTGRLDAAATHMVGGYKIARDRLGAGNRRVLFMVETVADVYERLGQSERAASYRRLLPAAEDSSGE